MAKQDKESQLYDLFILRATVCYGKDDGKFRNPGDEVKGVNYRDTMILLGDTGGNNNKACMVDSPQHKAFAKANKGKEKEKAPAAASE